MNRQDSHARRRSRAMTRALWLVALPVAVAIVACTAHDLQTPDPRPEKQTQLYRDVNPVRDLDIIFMIDNSLSMQEEQENLKRNFKAFVDILKTIPGGMPNVHMGVVSSDVGAGPTEVPGNDACSVRPGGDRGKFHAKEGCGLKQGQHYITSYDNGITNNFEGDLENVFGCIAELGTTGCGFEHQLMSVKYALSGYNPENAGFLRPDAFLAIVLITDEDDCSGAQDSNLYTDRGFPNQAPSLRCSLVGHVCNGNPPPGQPFQTTLDKCEANPTPSRLVPVQDFVDDIYKLKPNRPEKILTSAIIGWPVNSTPTAIASTPYAIQIQGNEMQGEYLNIEPVCSSAGNGQADPGLRIKKFVDGFGERGIVESICAGDFRPALERIADAIKANLLPGCVRAKLVDTDPETPGIQGECLVTDRIPDRNTGEITEQNVPSCVASNNKKPCYVLHPPGATDNACDNAWKVEVLREGEAPPDSVEAVSCRTCVDIGGKSLDNCG